MIAPRPTHYDLPRLLARAMVLRADLLQHIAEPWPTWQDHMYHVPDPTGELTRLLEGAEQVIRRLEMEMERDAPEPVFVARPWKSELRWKPKLRRA